MGALPLPRLIKVRRGGPFRAIRRRSELRPAGLLYVGTTVFVAVGAINSQNNLLFFVFGLGVSGMLLSGMLSGWALMALEVKREAVMDGEVGKPVSIHYRVTNRSRFFPAFGLVVGELHPQGKSSKDQPRGWAGFFSSPSACIAHIGPGQSVHATARVEALKRGEAVLSQVGVRSSFPFGLLRKSMVYEQRAELVIRPRIMPLRASVVRPGRGGHEAASASLARLGRGDEFFGVREYVAGDSPRMIAWKRSASSHTLIVRQNATPAPPRVWIELDRPIASGAEPLPEYLFERGLSLASSLADQLTQAGYAVGVRAPWLEIARSPQLGPRQAGRIGMDLARAEARPEQAPADGRRSPAPPIRRQTDRITIQFDGTDASGGSGLLLNAAAPDQWLAADAELPAEQVDPATLDLSRPALAARIRHAAAVFLGGSGGAS